MSDQDEPRIYLYPDDHGVNMPFTPRVEIQMMPEDQSAMLELFLKNTTPPAPGYGNFILWGIPEIPDSKITKDERDSF